MNRQYLYLTPVALWLSACGQTPRETKSPAPAPPVPVSVATVAETAWPDVYEAVGTVRARATADVASKLMGYVREVRVRTGDHVRSGQVLVVLDSGDLDVHKGRAEIGRAHV